jgi:polar amino acid transport system substrate-binding protein
MLSLTKTITDGAVRTCHGNDNQRQATARIDLDPGLRECYRACRQVHRYEAWRFLRAVPNPDAYVQSFGKGEWDIAIGPPVLAAPDKADSGADLWLIDLIYVAAPGKSFADVGQVDRPGVKVGVIQGSPSDRFLSDNLKAAEIVRTPLSAEISTDADELLRSSKADVFGADPGVGYPATDGLPGSKMVPGTFNVVRVAVALPKGRSSEAQAKIAEIVTEAKRIGIVEGTIEAAGLKGVRVAPN